MKIQHSPGSGRPGPVPPDFQKIFDQTQTIAVVGISDTPSKAARFVPEYLQDHGYRILGVHPRGSSEVAEKTATTLQELDEAIDMVVLFRRSDKVPEHLDDILSLEPKPKTVWMQLGIRNEEFARELRQNGIEVVSDRCTKVEHQRLAG